jgi:predicted DNA binding CopG/RHH family protein
MKKKLDQEEKDILSQYERGTLKSVVTSEASLRRYREYARATLSKNQRVNIRMSSVDLADIQARAAEEGIPYQTLMASVLHKFAAGRLREQRSSLTLPARRTARKGTAA